MVHMDMHLLQQHNTLVIPPQTFKEEMATTPASFNNETHIENRARSKMLKEYEAKMGKTGKKRPLSRIPLWYFLHEILEVERCKDLIGWEDEKNLVFTIKKPKELAVLWGQIKDKETMTYPKLARGIRYYYGKGVIEKFNGKRFSYKFIVSKKTKAVLSKRKNIPDEVDLSSSTRKVNKKRKGCADKECLTTKRRRERSNTDTSTDSSEVPSNTNSDWDEEDSFSESDWKSLDACITEFFSEGSAISSLFESMAEDTKPIVSSNSLNIDNTTFIMSSSPPELKAMMPNLESTYSTTCPAQRTISQRPLFGNLTTQPPMNFAYNSFNQTLMDNDFTRNDDDFARIPTYEDLASSYPSSESTYSRFDTPTKQKLFRKRSKSAETERLNPYKSSSVNYSMYTEESRNQNIHSSLPDFSAYFNEDNTNGIGSNFLESLLMEDSSSYMQDITVDTALLENLL